jgi:hypothetical protein
MSDYFFVVMCPDHESIRKHIKEYNFVKTVLLMLAIWKMMK